MSKFSSITDAVPADRGVDLNVTSYNKSVAPTRSVKSHTTPPLFCIEFLKSVEPQGSSDSQSILKRIRYSPDSRFSGNVHDGILFAYTPHEFETTFPLLSVPTLLSSEE